MGRKKRDKNEITPEQRTFLNVLAQNYGNISMACVVVGITRPTFYNWKKEPGFKEAYEGGEYEEALKDYIEAKLIEHLQSGNVTTAIFMAKTKCKDRGYVEQIEQKQTHQFIDSIKVKVVNGTGDRSKSDISED